jgi:hypothetical protein
MCSIWIRILLLIIWDKGDSDLSYISTPIDNEAVFSIDKYFFMGDDSDAEACYNITIFSPNRDVIIAEKVLCQESDEKETLSL